MENICPNGTMENSRMIPPSFQDVLFTTLFPALCAGLISICRSATSNAARKPAALASVSSYSASGFESATMPAPMLKCFFPRANHHKNGLRPAKKHAM